MAPLARGGGGGGDNKKDVGPTTTTSSGGATTASAHKRNIRETLQLVNTAIRIGESLFHAFVRIIGPLFVCLAVLLIGLCTCTYFAYILPDLRESVGLQGQIACTGIGVHLLGNLLYNYACAICKDPGRPPDYDEQVAVAAAESGQQPPRKCDRCGLMKPPRAHHCSVCKRCVLKMDHHCPWINNCVGWRNYRNFCLFLLYLTMGCCFVLVVYGPSLSLLLRPRLTSLPVAGDGSNLQTLSGGGALKQQMLQSTARRRPMSGNGKGCVFFSVMIAASILIAVSILGSFHAYLVLTNQTTIEFQINMERRRDARRGKDGVAFRNCYDMGRTRNFQQVFGPHRFWSCRWLLPPWCGGSKGPEGDGLEFPDSSRLNI